MFKTELFIQNKRSNKHKRRKRHRKEEERTDDNTQVQEQSSELCDLLRLKQQSQHKLRISVNVFDKEGCMYPDKSASKTPLNVAILNEMFKVNRSITRPKYVDNKSNRRDIARQSNRERTNEGGYPKKIKSGELLLPPYLWFKEEDSTPDPKGLAGEDNVQPSTSRDNQHNSTPDPWQRGLAGEDSHTNINTLMRTINEQDRKSILIDESTTTKRQFIIDGNFRNKKSALKRLGNRKASPAKELTDHSDPYHQRKYTTESRNQDNHLKQNNNGSQASRKYQENNQKSTPDPRQRGLAGENNRQYQGGNNNRNPERYRREEKGKDAHRRDTSRESRNNHNQERGLSTEFDNNWKHQNNTNKNKKAQNQQSDLT